MPAKRTPLRLVRPAERLQIIAGMATHEFAAKAQRPQRLLILGDGGVAGHELGEVLGVCAEAPLPHILVKEQKFLLEGVGGIASMLKYWGLAPSPSVRQAVNKLQPSNDSFWTRRACRGWLCARTCPKS